MACACTQRRKQRFLWYSTDNPEGVEPVIYNSEIEARAKVIRKGGHYVRYDSNVPIGTQIAVAEAARAAAGA